MCGRRVGAGARPRPVGRGRSGAAPVDALAAVGAAGAVVAFGAVVAPGAVAACRCLRCLRVPFGAAGDNAASVGAAGDQPGSEPCAFGALRDVAVGRLRVVRAVRFAPLRDGRLASVRERHAHRGPGSPLGEWGPSGSVRRRAAGALRAGRCRPGRGRTRRSRRVYRSPRPARSAASARLRTTVMRLDGLPRRPADPRAAGARVRSGLGPRRPRSRAGVGRALDLSARRVRAARAARTPATARALPRRVVHGGGPHNPSRSPPRPRGTRRRAVRGARPVRPVALGRPDRGQGRAGVLGLGPRGGRPSSRRPDRRALDAAVRGGRSIPGVGGTDLTVPVLVLVAALRHRLRRAQRDRASRD